jgi:acyl carrier protein
MNENELKTVLLNSIKKHSKIDVPEKDFDTDLTNMGIDSLTAVHIANDMEDALDIVIDDKDIVKFRTVNLILSYFEKQQ